MCTASSGSGDIFLQITAPTSYAWVALGQGSSMSGSQMFIVYTSADGNNVTVSPRLSSGHSMPQFTSDTQITLLEGSSVSNGQMTANFKCANCNSWSGGSMDFSSSSATWIHASKSGSALNSDDTSESISQHGNDYGSWDWDFSAAKGGSSANPFASGTATTTGGTSSGTQDCVPRPTGTGSGSGSSSGTSTTSSNGPPWAGGSRPTGYPPWNNDNDKRAESSDDDVNYCAPGQTPSSSSAGSQIGGGAALEAMQRARRMQTAHAVLACLAMVIFFPAGAISIRTFSFPGLVWFHGGLQVFAYAMFTAAVGLGIYIGQGEYIESYHGVIGLLVFSLLFFMPIFGWLHHKLFKKYGHRTFWSYIHIWLGRCLITLGIINGGLGLKLAGSPTDWVIAYSVVAGIIWLVYIATAVMGEARRKRAVAAAPPAYGTERKGSSHSSGSPSGSSQREFYGRKNRGEA
ncbi:hypothetical protein SLS57_010816 [Botryosphaeria dothidea]